MSDRKLQDLKFAQVRAEGALKGHVSFMLIQREHGDVADWMWERLREHHYEAQRATAELGDYLFSALTDRD